MLPTFVDVLPENTRQVRWSIGYRSVFFPTKLYLRGTVQKQSYTRIMSRSPFSFLLRAFVSSRGLMLVMQKTK